MQIGVDFRSPPPPTFVDVMSTAQKERVTKVLTGWRMTLSRDAATVFQFLSAYEDLPTRSLGSNAISCGHHIHEASEVEAILSSHLHGARRLAR